MVAPSERSELGGVGGNGDPGRVERDDLLTLFVLFLETDFVGLLLFLEVPLLQLAPTSIAPALGVSHLLGRPLP